MSLHTKETLAKYMIGGIILLIVMFLLPVFGTYALLILPFLIIGAVGGWFFGAPKKPQQIHGEEDNR